MPGTYSGWHMRATLGETPKADLALYARLDAVGQAVADLERRLGGDPARQKLNEPDTLSIGERIGTIRDGHWQTRQMPTATQWRSLEIAKAGLDALECDLKALIAGDLAKLEEAFAAAGGVGRGWTRAVWSRSGVSAPLSRSPGLPAL